jgi:hypothetical protein
VVHPFENPEADNHKKRKCPGDSPVNFHLLGKSGMILLARRLFSLF